MFKEKALQENINSLSKFTPADYEKINNDLANIYDRLKQGRDAFATVYNLNINTVSEISMLDLQIKFYIKQLLSIAENVKDASKGIY